MNIITRSESETIELGKKLGSILPSGSVVALEAPLASGKTYFTKGIALGLNITEEVTSPTFTIVSEYQGTLTLYHVDAYRLSSEEDFYDIGGEEMLFSDGVCVIEWPSIIERAIPQTALRVSIAVATEGTREFSFLGNDQIISKLKEII